jgi:hypothetical protein
MTCASRPIDRDNLEVFDLAAEGVPLLVATADALLELPDGAFVLALDGEPSGGDPLFEQRQSRGTVHGHPPVRSTATLDLSNMCSQVVCGGRNGFAVR